MVLSTSSIAKQRRSGFAGRSKQDRWSSFEGIERLERSEGAESRNANSSGFVIRCAKLPPHDFEHLMSSRQLCRAFAHNPTRAMTTAHVLSLVCSIGARDDAGRKSRRLCGDGIFVQSRQLSGPGGQKRGEICPRRGALVRRGEAARRHIRRSDAKWLCRVTYLDQAPGQRSEDGLTIHPRGRPRKQGDSPVANNIVLTGSVENWWLIAKHRVRQHS